MTTLAVAGLPLLQYDNSDSLVATQSLSRALDIGIFATCAEDLGAQLRDEGRMAELRGTVWRARERFMFDSHVDDLVAFFRRVAASAAH
jgi:hypothetical protein